MEIEQVLMWVAVWIVGSVIFGCCVAYVLLLRNKYVRKKMLGEVEEWLETYRKDITDNNRFIINLTLLHEAFPEYSIDVVKDVWKEIRQAGMVKEDVMDKEWIVRP